MRQSSFYNNYDSYNIQRFMEIFLFIIAIILFAIGILGIVLPAIPSLPVIWLGVLNYGFFTGFADVTGKVVLLTGIMALLGTVLDMIAAALGAKVYGSSWMGIVGAIVGGLIGIILANVPGLLLGTAGGTFVGEYMRLGDQKTALRATWGSMLGFFCGVVLKIVFAAWIVIAFLQAVF